MSLWLVLLLLAAEAAPSPAGAYEIFICKGSCSFSQESNVVVHGILVLVPDSFPKKGFDDLLKHEFEEKYYTFEKPNACFALQVNVKDRTYAGITPRGIGSWSIKGSEITARLSSSPDAGYFARLRVTGDQVAGSGASWAVGVAEPPMSPDVIVGRRVGPALANRCIEAPHRAE